MHTLGYSQSNSYLMVGVSFRGLDHSMADAQAQDQVDRGAPTLDRTAWWHTARLDQFANSTLVEEKPRPHGQLIGFLRQQRIPRAPGASSSRSTHHPAAPCWISSPAPAPSARPLPSTAARACLSTTTPRPCGSWPAVWRSTRLRWRRQSPRSTIPTGCGAPASGKHRLRKGHPPDSNGYCLNLLRRSFSPMSESPTPVGRRVRHANGRSTVEPVVRRSSMARCTSAASRSG